jgi:hypothetical protein
MPGLNRLRFWGLLDFRCFLLAKRKHISPLKIAFVGAQHVVPRQIRYLTLIIILVKENLNHAKRDTVTGLRLSILRAQIKDKKRKSHSRMLLSGIQTDRHRCMWEWQNIFYWGMGKKKLSFPAGGKKLNHAKRDTFSGFQLPRIFNARPSTILNLPSSIL